MKYVILLTYTHQAFKPGRNLQTLFWSPYKYNVTNFATFYLERNCWSAGVAVKLYVNKKQFCAPQWLMSAAIIYRCRNLISCTRKIIKINVNCDLFSCLITLLGTYILRGHIWHRNELSSRQLEFLVSCRNDEHQTPLERDWWSNPVAPECRVSQTLRLRHFTVNKLIKSLRTMQQYIQCTSCLSIRVSCQMVTLKRIPNSVISWLNINT
jgi:hypothetical protein